MSSLFFFFFPLEAQKIQDFSKYKQTPAYI